MAIRDRFLHFPAAIVPRDGTTRTIILQDRESGKYEIEKSTQNPGVVVGDFRKLTTLK